MSYKNLSNREAHLLNKIDEAGLAVFGLRELVEITGWNRSRANNHLSSLRRKGIVKKIKRGNFVLSSDIPDRSFEIATEMFSPCYISFWTALSYYGFTDQQVITVQLISSRQMKGVEDGPVKIETTTFKDKRFYGYRKENGFSIAEEEKALVDSLYMPEKVGGLEELSNCLSTAWESMDEKSFTQYLLKFGNKSMVSRAGYLIENLELEFGEFGRLEENKSESYVKLSPCNSKNKKYDNHWNLIVNKEVTP